MSNNSCLTKHLVLIGGNFLQHVSMRRCAQLEWDAVQRLFLEPDYNLRLVWLCGAAMARTRPGGRCN